VLGARNTAGRKNPLWWANEANQGFCTSVKDFLDERVQQFPINIIGSRASNGGSEEPMTNPYSDKVRAKLACSINTAISIQIENLIGSELEIQLLREPR